MDPRDFPLRRHFLEHIVVRHQVTNSNVVLFSGIDLREGGDEVSGDVRIDSRIVFRAVFPGIRRILSLCPHPGPGDTPVAVPQHVPDRPLDLGIFRYFGKQMHLRRNRRHQLSPMTVHEQVNLNPAVVERLQQPEQAPFGAAKFQIVDGE